QLDAALYRRHLFITHSGVASAEIHNASRELLDAFAAADRVIRQRNAGMTSLIFFLPFFIERRGKRCAGSLQLNCASGRIAASAVASAGGPEAAQRNNRYEQRNTMTSNHKRITAPPPQLNSPRIYCFVYSSWGLLKISLVSPYSTRYPVRPPPE